MITIQPCGALNTPAGNTTLWWGPKRFGTHSPLVKWFISELPSW